MRWVLALGFGLLLPFAVIWFGPKHTVVCTDTGWPNSAFGDQFGHYDGPDSTGCDVPAFGTWITAILVLVALALVVAITRRRSRAAAIQNIC